MSFSFSFSFSNPGGTRVSERVWELNHPTISGVGSTEEASVYKGLVHIRLRIIGLNQLEYCWARLNPPVDM